MSQPQFKRYNPPPSIHDACIVDVRREGSHLDVLCEANGGSFTIRFLFVSLVRSLRPQEMFVYSLSEMESASPDRHFVFTNWEGEDDSALEVFARDIRVLEAER